MKDAYSYYIEPFENFDQVIAWESPARYSVSGSNNRNQTTTNFFFPGS